MINLIESAEKAILVEKITHLIHKKVTAEQRAMLTAFTHRYYMNVAYDDLAESDIGNLAAATLSHWNFMYQRAPGEIKVRVYNPTVAEQGWSSKHTIVDIAHDDMPFLVDSSRLEITRRGIAVHIVIHTGGIKLQRNSNHQITRIVDTVAPGIQFLVEAPIHFEINHISDLALQNELSVNIKRVLGDVCHVVADWQPMLNKVRESLDDLEKNPSVLPADEIAESKLFLSWLMNNHFTFLSCCDYVLTHNGKEQALKMVPNSGLGVHSNKTTSRVYRNVSEMPLRAQALLLSPQILIIAKTNTKSTVHRDVYTDYIGIKRFNDKNELIGERRFIGLYTSSAYNDSPRHIPLLRHKVDKVFANSKLSKNSHAGKALMDILESFPRDELFQASIKELTTLCMGIVNLQERDKVRLFARKDIYNRYFSCLVYVPRERYDTKLQQVMQKILESALKGKGVSVNASISDSVLARLHYIIHLGKKTPAEYDFKSIEQKLIAAAKLWHDSLVDLLIETYNEELGNKIFSRYKNAFPNSYCEIYTPQVALADIKYLELLNAENPVAIGLYQLNTAGQKNLHLKIFKLDDTMPLSVAMPILESLGLSVINEHPYKVVLSTDKVIWIHDFDTTLAKTARVNLSLIKSAFKEAFKKIYFAEAENDGFNRLVLLAQLTWREAALLRALAKFALQINFKFSQNYIENTFSHYPNITQKIVALFILRFDPSKHTNRIVKLKNLEKSLLIDIEKVSSLDEDIIFRFYFTVINATLRTNFFQKTRSNLDKTYFSFKFASEKIPDLPLPKPKYEIFVYSPDFEAVHLRAAKVSRGGIRWSDRPEDFRTEVLGLMKAQHVKNAVIVPAGAKGGFYPKKLPDTTDQNLINQAAIECYKKFICGMLDITDNIINKKIVTPTDVISYDSNDPYLVVAADKGTASFSDIANQISAEYNFWLGDAFASGGSFGYDHKKMGITARGVWELVKRHFNRLNIDMQSNNFTIVGIGGMSGDVFGNGILLSNHGKLIGAFNHQHIFIDPNPDAGISFKERQRLFKLPRSGWLDYDPTLISQGGGVFERSAKSIALSPEMAVAFDLQVAQIEPNELIRALLRARVDLLFNGGIGTYVKSTAENDFQVGDKINDAVRINAATLRCKVVGEGGNLGFTQLARIEYALNKGNIYTDSLDNSAGVNCSDHEVNLKILFNDMISQGQLDMPSRNKLLPQLTAQIAQLVLRDCYNQGQAIDLGYLHAKTIFDVYQRYINELSNKGLLNRQLESLPGEKTLHERHLNGTYLTKPELFILFAYTKIFLKQRLLKTAIPDDSYFADFIKLEFPTEINQKFAKQLQQHSLRREIIATQISTMLVNEMGCVFIYLIMDETGASVAEIVHAYVAVRDIFAISKVWQAVEALDGKIDSQQQLMLLLQLTNVVRRATRWVLNYHRSQLNVTAIVDKFAKDVQDFSAALPKLLSGESKLNLTNKISEYHHAGIPLTLASDMACINGSFAALDIVASAQQHELPVTQVAKTCFMLCNELDLIWLREQIDVQNTLNQWDTLAIAALCDQLDHLQSVLAINVLRYTKNVEHQSQTEINFTAWQQNYKPVIERWQLVMAALKQSSQVDITMLFVALKNLADLVNITK